MSCANLQEAKQLKAQIGQLELNLQSWQAKHKDVGPLTLAQKIIWADYGILTSTKRETLQIDSMHHLTFVQGPHLLCMACTHTPPLHTLMVCWLTPGNGDRPATNRELA